MNLYSNLSINIISLVISIISYILLEFFISYFLTPPIKIKANFITTRINTQNEQTDTNQQNNVEIQNSLEKIETEDVQVQTNTANKLNSEWYLEIKSINLKASINEGTSRDTMENYIGHFEETPKWDGNVGLAAHNRGYQNNYFQDLKDLEIGDEIIYCYNGKQRKYQVIKKQIIKDTDWTTLEETLENTITLITCVENEPEYRRCVQGKEIT